MQVAFRVCCLFLALLACLPLHYLWKIARAPSPWPRLFLGRAARIAGMRSEIVGRPLRSHVLFVANHLSWLDILLLAGATGSAFVSKAEVARYPLIGWLARLNRTIFVARAERGAVRGQVDAVRSTLATGQPVALFPEGTTAGGDEVLPFRASLFASLYPPSPDIRVQPVAIDYGKAASDIAWVGDEPAKANALRILRRKGHVPVRLYFLEPVDPASIPDRKLLADAARSEIVAALAPSSTLADAV